MAKLLYVEASPRKERSHSIAVAREFLDAYKRQNPHDEIETLDLWSADLPSFDGDTIDAKYAILHGEEHTPAQAAAWKRIVDTFEHFNSADRYLFSTPMWNFGVPYRLKQLIDVITQPGLAFSYSPEEGYNGLVTGKPAVAILARGGVYTAETGMASYDVQKPYFELWLRFIGFTRVQTILIEGTLVDPETANRSRGDAIAAARNAAQQM